MSGFCRYGKDKNLTEIQYDHARRQRYVAWVVEDLVCKGRSVYQ